MTGAAVSLKHGLLLRLQCEQTANGTGCTTIGQVRRVPCFVLWPGETARQQQTAVPFLTSSSSSYTLQCGKTPEVAGLQDLLVYTLKGLGTLAVKARAAGIVDDQVNSFIMRAMFSTLT